ncbi:MAG: addiction module protein [Opitutae bacterium]|nr:addiction module protein [Opitutae bacterium]
MAEQPRLSADERDEIPTLLDELSGFFGADGWRNDSDLSLAQKEERARRLAELEDNPAIGVPWEEVRARLRQQLSP